MRRSRRIWAGFAAGAVLGVAILAWISVMALDLERAESSARAMRLALWRMDSWLAPHLAVEAARPSADYAPLPQAEGAGVMPAETLLPPALLTFRSEFIRLHFEEVPMAAPGASMTCTSPQVLSPAQAKIAGEWGLDLSAFDRNDDLLAHVHSILDLEACRSAVAESEPRLIAAQAVEPRVAHSALPAGEDQVQERQTDVQGLNLTEFSKRSQTIASYSNTAQSAATWAQVRSTEDSAPPGVGPLVPIWIDAQGTARASGTPELVFLRRVREANGERLQGFLVDWRRLRTLLLGEIHDLFPGAALRPVTTDLGRSAEEGTLLATVPVALDSGALARALQGAWTPATLTLVIAWCAALVALTATAVTLRAGIAFGDRRARFASAVTHELRTPLTTFRMYSEMLAEGMVTDPAQRQVYLDTLEAESARLASLVENVLAYARVEEGRHPDRRALHTLGALVERLRPPLERRAHEASADLRIDAGDAETARVFVDADAVGQILFNLIDNACKYGCAGADARIDLCARRRDGRIEIQVRDHGPGVTAAARSGLFSPFDRGGREASATPGVGLGLALSRELARAMRGDLRYQGDVAPGASFLLVLPVYE